MTTAEARWRAERMQHLLDDGMERFEAMALVRQGRQDCGWALRAAGSALDYQMPQASRASVNPRLHARSVLPNADGETPARRAASAGASPSTSTSRAASAADTN